MLKETMKERTKERGREKSVRRSISLKEEARGIQRHCLS